MISDFLDLEVAGDLVKTMDPLVSGNIRHQEVVVKKEGLLLKVFGRFQDKASGVPETQ